MSERYVEKILRARVYEVAQETPLEYMPKLSGRLNNRIYLKREDLQPVFSFKLRGAYNKISGLSPEERARGVITASAGNHAQGVALAAGKLGVKSLIVMPKTTPSIKVRSVQDLGGKALLYGDSYDDAYEYAMELAQKNNLLFVHPFDDPEVIAGQGTIGVEMLRQHAGPPHAIFVPVGGGGLIAGVGAYVKYVYPEVKIIGVEPEEAPSMQQAMKLNRRVRLKQVGIFADGVAVRQIGKENFRVAKQVVDDMVLVTTDEICAAIKDQFDDTRAIVEPAGALAVAGLKRYVKEQNIKGEHLLAIASGANINFDRLRHVAERADLGESREALLAVRIPERPGSFLEFCRALGKRSVTEFNYRYRDANDAYVFVGIELTHGDQERYRVIDQLKNRGYSVTDMTENELAKLHIRYMVGGHAPAIIRESLYRIEFPERPGALLDFLSHIGQRWNISLFHYRNHGAAYGRVLMGVQVQKENRHKLKSVLRQFGLSCCEETDNPAYHLFASPDGVSD